MPTAFEALKQKSVQQSQSLSAFDALKKKSVSQPTVEVKKPGLFQSMVQETAQPFLKTALTAGKAAKGLFGIATKDIETLKQAASEEEHDFGYFGKVKPLKTVGEAVGTGLEIGSYFVPVGAAKAGATQVTKGLVKQAAKTGAKAGLTTGLLHGSGSALADKKPVDEVVLQTLWEGGLGAGFGALTGAATAKIGQRFTPAGKQTRIENLEEKVSQKYANTINLSKTQRALEQRSGKDVSKFLVREGVPIRVEQGKLYANDAIEALKSKASAENSAFTKLLADDGSYLNLNKAKDLAKSNVEAIGVSREQANNYIEKQFNSFIGQYKNQLVKNADGSFSIPKALGNVIKKKMWEEGKFNVLAPQAEQTRAGASRLIGNAFKRGIEDGTQDANIKLMNQRLGDLAEAITMLENRNGSVVRGGLMGKYFARTIGAIAGTQGGPLGSVGGAYTADKIADVLSDPNVTTWYARRLLLKLQKEGNQSLIDQVENILQQRAGERATRFLLPQKASPSNFPIPLPSKFSSKIEFLGRNLIPK